MTGMSVCGEAEGGDECVRGWQGPPGSVDLGRCGFCEELEGNSRMGREESLAAHGECGALSSRQGRAAESSWGSRVGGSQSTSL